ncbi:hypothetical protein FDP41_008382 [Naegleria fowleri]|uniref:Uncharacterized protein n=1 Tax=Naegleria fowleri TaxID=5763 RepID=A0A6A5BGN4_NAEFO|nr:uncharacterized protein FDP41_008382 [Naegleria fowleri]KAF0973175.1 hypothetical protein FDP41_008382 [Naegleria fowleri]
MMNSTDLPPSNLESCSSLKRAAGATDPLLDEHNHIDPSHQVTGKISGRYTQLRKQLRQCNHFTENYFVLEVNPSNTSSQQAMKQQKRNQRKKRKQQTHTAKTSSCKPRSKKVKQEKPCMENTRDSSLDATSPEQPPSTLSTQEPQPTVENFNINNSESSSTTSSSPNSLNFVNPFSVEQQAQLMKVLEQMLLQSFLMNSASETMFLQTEAPFENFASVGTTMVSPVATTVPSDQIGDMSDFCDMNFDLL